MNLKRNLIYGTGWSFLKNGGEQFISFIVFLMLARFLSPEAFGLIAMAKAFIGILDQFSDFGFSTAIIQKKNVREEHLSSAFWFNFIISLILASVFYISSPFVAKLYDEPQLLLVTQLLSVVFIISGLKHVQISLLKKQLEFKLLAICGLISSSIAGFIGILMALNNFGVYSLVAYQVTLVLTQMIMYWYVSGWWPKLLFSFSHFKELWAFGINVTGWRFFSSSTGRIFDYLVGFYFGATILGYFTIALKLINSVNNLFTRTVWRVLFPVFATVKDDILKVKSGFLRVNRLLIGLVVPVYFLLALNSDYIVALVFGEKWLITANLLSILIIAGIAEAQSGIVRQFLLARGRVKIITVSTFIGLMLMTTLIVWLKEENYELLAVVYAISFTIPMFITLIFLVRDLKIDFKDTLLSYVVAFNNLFALTFIWLLVEYYPVNNFILFAATVSVSVIITSYLFWVEFKRIKSELY